MQDVPIYLINLDCSGDRLARATEALYAQSATFERIPGIDGRKSVPSDFSEYDRAGARSYMGRDLNGGEVGCFLSHRRAVKAFLDSGAPFGLVLEDDMQPASHALALVQALVDWQTDRGPVDWHAANLGPKRMKVMTKAGDISAAGSSAVIMRGHYFPMLATAVLWTRTGAEIFLKKSLPIVCPLDVFLRRWLTASDMGLTLEPPPFTTTGAASDIDTSHKATRRSLDGRSRSYHWRRIRRTISDHLRARLNKARWKLK